MKRFYLPVEEIMDHVTGVKQLRYSCIDMILCLFH